VATEGATIERGRSRPLPRAELVLLGLTVLGLALVPIHLKTIYSGLPAHPLFLHVPVILIPIAAIGAVLLAIRPEWIPRHGVWLAVLTLAALVGTILTMGAGAALRDALGGGFGPDASLIDRHAHAADILRILTFGLTLALILTVLAYRRPLGVAAVDRLLARSEARVALRAALATLAVASAYFVFHTGDLGAKAVWGDRLNRGAGRGGQFPGGAQFPGGSGAPSGAQGQGPAGG
jgi:hypothetical protein